MYRGRDHSDIPNTIVPSLSVVSRQPSPLGTPVRNCLPLVLDLSVSRTPYRPTPLSCERFHTSDLCTLYSVPGDGVLSFVFKRFWNYIRPDPQLMWTYGQRTVLPKVFSFFILLLSNFCLITPLFIGSAICRQRRRRPRTGWVRGRDCVPTDLLPQEL